MSGLIPDQPLTASDPLRLGLYAWVIYGVLIVTNWSYYSNRFYYTYTMSEYRWFHAAWRTRYGFGTFIRDTLKTLGWGIVGFFWAISLIPSPITFSWFAQATTVLLSIDAMALGAVITRALGIF